MPITERIQELRKQTGRDRVWAGIFASSSGFGALTLANEIAKGPLGPDHRPSLISTGAFVVTSINAVFRSLRAVQGGQELAALEAVVAAHELNQEPARTETELETLA